MVMIKQILGKMVLVKSGRLGVAQKKVLLEWLFLQVMITRRIRIWMEATEIIDQDIRIVFKV
jgi:hypothetical protein